MSSRIDEAVRRLRELAEGATHETDAPIWGYSNFGDKCNDWAVVATDPPVHGHFDEAEWFDPETDLHIEGAPIRLGTVAECDERGAVADYIATLHPGVAEAVADLLDVAQENVDSQVTTDSWARQRDAAQRLAALIVPEGGE